jgi:acyl-CoA dehydrogenase
VDSLVRALLAVSPPAVATFTVPVDRALVAAASADRLGVAFIAGYTEALRALVPTATDALALCATEEGGNQPRAIRTTLSRRDDDNGWVVSGKKKWATGASSAGTLLVVASTGVDAAGRNRLRLVRIPTSAPGVRMTSSAAPFVPEIEHAEIELDHVVITEADILPGDGYDDYLKPFRTVEDAHVHAAVAAYLLGVARRHGWHDLVERLLALALAARAVATAEPTLPTTHIALAGVLALAAHEIADLESRWNTAATSDPATPDPEWTRWLRDRPLLKTAAAARAARRERAWQQLG